MTLLTIAKAVARNVGVDPPTAVLSTASGAAPMIAQFTREAATEIVRRVDWTALRATTTIVGIGQDVDYDLPPAFQRLISGMAVKIDGVAIRGGVSADEWASLTAVAGTPRYFRLINNQISFYPYPAAAASITVTYQSKNWCSNDTNDWSSDTDTALISEDLITKGAIWRWKRHVGGDFQDHLGEFEAALADLARFDEGARMP